MLDGDIVVVNEHELSFANGRIDRVENTKQLVTIEEDFGLVRHGEQKFGERAIGKSY
jgi:hypothetical protein